MSRVLLTLRGLDYKSNVTFFFFLSYPVIYSNQEKRRALKETSNNGKKNKASLFKHKKQGISNSSIFICA